jgi:hypothetical protein
VRRAEPARDDRPPATNGRMALPLLLVRNLLYPLLALVGSVLGSLVLWLRSRKPTSLESSIDDFHKGLKALEPDGRPQEPAGPLTGRPHAGRAP